MSKRQPYDKYTEVMKSYLKTQIHQLRTKEEMTFKQISRKLGIPYTTVFNLYSEYLTELGTKRLAKPMAYINSLVGKVKEFVSKIHQ